MPGDRIGSLLLQGFGPVLGPPLTGVGRIDPDDRDAPSGRHRAQPGAELAGGNAGHGTAEPFPPVSVAQRVAAGGAGIGEVQVLDHHRRAVMDLGVVEQGGDRCADPPIALRGGQSRGVEGIVIGSPTGFPDPSSTQQAK
jgi:hypothetical protein